MPDSPENLRRRLVEIDDALTHPTTSCTKPNPILAEVCAILRSQSAEPRKPVGRERIRSTGRWRGPHGPIIEWDAPGP